MPGGGCGGGKPPMVTCPRCHRETRDSASELVTGCSIALGIGATFGAACVAAPVASWLANGLGPVMLVFPVAFVGLAYRCVARHAVKTRLEHECAHCAFRWRFASGLAKDLADPRVELDLELWRLGFARIERPGETRYERSGGRTLSVDLSTDTLRLAVVLAHPETLTRAQRTHVEERLQTLADTVGPTLRRTNLRTVSLGEGEVRAVVGPWGADELPDLLRRLESAAGELLLVAAVRVAGERHDHARCAVCHEDLADSLSEASVACPRCATVVHRECWSELGRCPVLGCRGTLAAARSLAA